MKSLSLVNVLVFTAASWVTQDACAAAFELSPNIATRDISLTLSASGYLNNQTITATSDLFYTSTEGFPSPAQLIPQREQPYTVLAPIRAYVYVYAIDDKPDGSKCINVNDSSSSDYTCLDGAAPPGSYEAYINNFGDSELEYVRLNNGENIQVDQPSFVHYGNPQGSNNSPYGIILGEVPLSLLASNSQSESFLSGLDGLYSTHYSANITVTGDLYLTSARLVIDYQLNDANPSAVPLPPALWLFGSTLIGLLSMQKRCRNSA